MRSFSSCLMFGLQAMAVAMGAESVPAAPAPLPYRVAARLSDTAELLTPSAVRLDGWLGHRIAINESVRLLNVDTEPPIRRGLPVTC